MALAQGFIFIASYPCSDLTKVIIITTILQIEKLRLRKGRSVSGRYGAGTYISKIPKAGINTTSLWSNTTMLTKPQRGWIPGHLLSLLPAMV